MMLQDIDMMPEKGNWAVLVKRLLGSLGFNEVWLAQGVGNVNIFKIWSNKDYTITLFRLGIQDWKIQVEQILIHAYIRSNFNII